MTPVVPGAPEPRMYLRSGYFLVYIYTVKPRFSNIQNSKKPRFSKHFAADGFKFFTKKAYKIVKKPHLVNKSLLTKHVTKWGFYCTLKLTQ